MGFKTDGSVHHSGIENERKTAEILTEKNIFGCEVETRGGTKVKEDIVAGNVKMSVKEKKNLSDGSFDWTNTSKYNKIFGSHFDTFKEEVSEIRKMDADDRKKCLLSIKSKFADTCSGGFGYFSDEHLQDLIVNSICDSRIDKVVINDKQNNDLYMFDPADHPAVNMAKTCDSMDLRGSGKGSRKVVFIKDGVEYDYGIRLRITCNNGVSAFLKLSKANNNSQVVIKLQQDTVHKLVKQWIDCDVISY